jgi:hypothetical protein
VRASNMAVSCGRRMATSSEPSNSRAQVLSEIFAFLWLLMFILHVGLLRKMICILGSYPACETLDLPISNLNFLCPLLSSPSSRLYSVHRRQVPQRCRVRLLAANSPGWMSHSQSPPQVPQSFSPRVMPRCPPELV